MSDKFENVSEAVQVDFEAAESGRQIRPGPMACAGITHRAADWSRAHGRQRSRPGHGAAMDRLRAAASATVGALCPVLVKRELVSKDWSNADGAEAFGQARASRRCP